ncbi:MULTISPECIES: DedA family protein [unclassified Bacillus (in: firmicutes)]|uniref:DedA family protein n=1 Tax=unclassified Bacillus (in: firmicutes) TaxID=185979 RepID=UPI001BEBEDCC|nr:MULTISPECIES: DedA family protein [unclassified Bacillus (in: firmicutes)]MBT2638116.1 DedA family protein [Bacillus sp. ISL-39]MBT2659439.1 DedA family protein [Bacillus sp. ISL-45]
MDLELVINIIEDNGYLGLFLWLWFGVFVIPVPNEVILMTVGLASAKGALNPVLAFLVTYMGISAAFTSSYSLGRIIGRRVLRLLEKKKRFANSIESAIKLMEKYHAFSLSLSCFAPGVRYLVPLLYGFSRLPFKTFAIFAYSGAFVWVSIIFVLGYLFGDKMDIVMKYNKEVWLVILALAIITFIFVLRRRKIKAAIGTEEVILQERQSK